MKKIISLIICLAMVFATAISSAALFSFEAAPDELKSDLNLVQADCDLASVVAFGSDESGKAAVIGYDKNEKMSLWMVNGTSVTKSDADILALADQNLDYPRSDIETDGVYVSDVYFFDGAYYIVCCIEYYCTCTEVDDGFPHDFTAKTALLRTVNGKDFTAVTMPDISETMFSAGSGVTINKFGNKLIFAANSAGFTKTGEKTNEYGYLVQTGVSYYYTSEDSINWTRHASIEVESQMLGTNSWRYQGVSADGTAIFQRFAEGPTITGGRSQGYWCTSDFTTYKELPTSVFGDEYCYNIFNLARAHGSSDQTSFLFQSTMAEDYENGGLKTNGFKVFAADDASGEWIQKVDYSGSWNYYHYFVYDNVGCLMLDTGNGVNVYKWDGANGSVTASVTDINPADFSTGGSYKYNDKDLFYMLYKNNSLAVTTDMWDSAVILDLPANFANFFVAGNTGIFVGENVYTVDLKKLSASALGEKLPVLSGDSTGDGKINLADVSLALKYVARWDVNIDLDAADVTGDGKVNLSDVSLVLKYIAKWDVVLGK